MTRVLVVHGSKRGATAEIAGWIGAAMREVGVEADVKPAAGANELEGYDAVVVGGALYAGRWHADARRFVRRHAGALRQRRVWLFASGPLDHTAETGEIKPVLAVRRAMARIGAEEQITFGGRLDAGAQGFIASRLAKERGGDFRDRDQVRDWAAGIVADLRTIAV